MWAKRHPIEVTLAELLLSRQFEEQYPDITDTTTTTTTTATQALDLLEDDSGVVPPSVKAGCCCWIASHRELVSIAQDERQQYQADQFAEHFADNNNNNNVAEIAFKILNKFATSEEMAWVDYADHWRLLPLLMLLLLLLLLTILMVLLLKILALLLLKLLLPY